MTLLISDIIMIIVTISFGMWFLIFPKSVIRFYTWFFHMCNYEFPAHEPIKIRMAGLIWIVFISVIFITIFLK